MHSKFLTCGALLLALFSGVWSSAQAQSAQVSKQQESYDRQTITITIGGLPQQHTLSLAAYQVLLSQGVPIQIIRTAPVVHRENSARAMAPVWATGVYR